MADWYYAKEGQQHGPISSAQLRQMATSGQLLPDDLVFREGGKDWVAASTVNGLFPAAGGRAVAPQPTAGGAAFAFDEPAAPARGGRDRDRDDRDRDRDKDRDRDRDRREDDYDDYPPPKPGGGFLVDVLMLRRMVAPFLVLLLYWVGSAGIVLGNLVVGVMVMFAPRAGALGVVTGIAMILLGIPIGLLVWRLYCELAILLFRIYEALVEVKDKLGTPPKS